MMVYLVLSSPATCPGEDVPTSVPRIHRSPWIHQRFWGWPLGSIGFSGWPWRKPRQSDTAKSIDFNIVFLGRKAWKTCGFRLCFCSSVPVAKFRDIGGVGVSCAPCLPEILTDDWDHKQFQVSNPFNTKKKNLTTPSQPISKQKVRQDPKHPINHL
jgi:hypothetical protein